MGSPLGEEAIEWALRQESMLSYIYQSPTRTDLQGGGSTTPVFPADSVQLHGDSGTALGAIDFPPSEEALQWALGQELMLSYIYQSPPSQAFRCGASETPATTAEGLQLVGQASASNVEQAVRCEDSTKPAFPADSAGSGTDERR
jgi:hypothetical protein